MVYKIFDIDIGRRVVVKMKRDSDLWVYAITEDSVGVKLGSAGDS